MRGQRVGVGIGYQLLANSTVRYRRRGSKVGARKRYLCTYDYQYSCTLVHVYV